MHWRQHLQWIGVASVEIYEVLDSNVSMANRKVDSMHNTVRKDNSHRVMQSVERELKAYQQRA